MNIPSASSRQLDKRKLYHWPDFTPPQPQNAAASVAYFVTAVYNAYRYRAVFNPYLVASTPSGIRQGIIKAEDVLRSDGTEITYSLDLSAARQPAERTGNITGRRPYITRDAFQSMYHSEHEKRIRAEKRIADHENNGLLTPEQFSALRGVQDDPTVSDQMRKTLTLAFESSRTDPMTEIPTVATAMENKRRV